MNSSRLTSWICAAFVGLIVCSAQTGSPQAGAPQPGSVLIDSMEGVALYRAYCATCHGADGKGFGPMTEWLKRKTPDLTTIAVREGGKFPLARVQRIISGEENMTAGHGTREMPVWGPIFSQVARDQDLGRMRVYNLAKSIEKMQTARTDRTAH